MNAATVIPDRQAGDPWTPELFTQEHIDLHGHLHVPVRGWADKSPNREGWEPFWVNINLDRDPIKVVVYRKEAK